jgi:hypothetical protein
VGFHNRPADRQAHAEALLLGRVECVKNVFDILRVQAQARVPDRDQNMSRFPLTMGLVPRRRAIVD